MAVNAEKTGENKPGYIFFLKQEDEMKHEKQPRQRANKTPPQLARFHGQKIRPQNEPTASSKGLFPFPATTAAGAAPIGSKEVSVLPGVTATAAAAVRFEIPGVTCGFAR